MLRLLIITLLVLAALATLRHLVGRNASLTTRQKKKLLAIGLLALVFMLVISGKAHWLMAVGAAGLGALRALLPFLIRHWAHLGALHQFGKNKPTQSQSNQHTHNPPSKAQMSKEEACTILGVSEDASRKDILAAYKRLMQRCHPDRGGSDYLATKLNAAKKRLLG